MHDRRWCFYMAVFFSPRSCTMKCMAMELKSTTFSLKVCWEPSDGALFGYRGTQTVRAFKLTLRVWHYIPLYGECRHNLSWTSRTIKTYCLFEVILFTVPKTKFQSGLRSFYKNYRVPQVPQVPQVPRSANLQLSNTQIIVFMTRVFKII